MDTVSVVVGSCDPLVSIGLNHILRKDTRLRVLGEGLDKGAIERAVANQKPTVVILDELNIMEISFLGTLKAASHITRIIVLAHQPPRMYSLRLFAAGASCLAKSASPTEILATIHAVAIDKAIAGTTSLTPQQVVVLQYMCEGKTYAEIASALGLSSETVRTHSAHIRRKLGVKNKRELIGIPIPPSRDIAAY
jgi:DNA-binding NarL/FixJ family response regulator